jgi:short-subunit dehydrogenase
MYGHVIITGASSGFGMAFARRLVGECAHMVLVARRKEVLMELSDELQAANPSLKVTVKACDLSSPSVRDSLVEELQALPEGKMLLIMHKFQTNLSRLVLGKYRQNNMKK